MSEWFFRSNGPGYPHPVSSELENSGIRVAVGDCSVTERRRWRLPYQTGKTVHVLAKHYKYNEDGCMAPGVCGNGSVPLSHSGNVVTRMEYTYTHTQCQFVSWAHSVNTSSQQVKLSELLILVHWLVAKVFTPLLVQVTFLCVGNQTPGREVLSLSLELARTWDCQINRPGLNPLSYRDPWERGSGETKKTLWYVR